MTTARRRCQGRSPNTTVAMPFLWVVLLAVMTLSACGPAASDRDPTAAGGAEPAAGRGVREWAHKGEALAPRVPAAEELKLATGISHSMAVPILMYHYIRVNPVPDDRVGAGLSVTPEHFSAQMDALAARGVHSITPTQLVYAMQVGAPLPPNPVILTFDDGYADFATTAVPILVAHHFVAVSYVITGKIGTPNYMTAEQLKQVEAVGMVIGAHTVHHLALAKVSPASANAEIVQSKAALEQLLGHPVVDFCYPFGSFNAQVVAMVQAAGFLDAVTTVAGLSHPPATVFTLTRQRVGGGDTVENVLQKASL